MGRYFIKRILFLIPTILAIIFIMYGIVSLTPGDPAHVILGPQATPEAYANLNRELGYDQPFVVKYVNYVINLFKGDLGNSYLTGRPVFNEIMLRLPVTVTLAVSALLIAVMIGIPLGILAAVKQYSIQDFMGTFVAMLAASIPGFWLGLLAIWLFSMHLGWLPSYGNDTWVHYILPAFTVAVPQAARLLRITRTTMLETIRQDYVRTARAKGQTEGKVIFRHALKNALLPVITIAGMDFGYILGGTVVIESVFSINGVGLQLLQAIQWKDAPQIVGSVTFLGTLFVLVMLVVDILYAYIDPTIRARYQKG